MEVEIKTPRVSSFLQVRLDKNIVDYLWSLIDTANNKKKSFKNNLAGNISESLLLEDIDSFFYKSVCSPLVKYYRKNNPISNGDDPVAINTVKGAKAKLLLDQFWVNYQYKTEFNPFHDHSGVYSFVIWMKIPYTWDEQSKLPQFSGIDQINRKAGNFEFEYIDTLGDVKTICYQLDPRVEGFMLFFPARLRHCVYPFYETEEPRISIAGNLSYSFLK